MCVLHARVLTDPRAEAALSFERLHCNATSTIYVCVCGCVGVCVRGGVCVCV